jgi:hypothetical protein
MKQETDNPGKMIQTLCVLFFAILLRDYSTNNLQWHWLIPLAAAIICLIFVNASVILQQKARQNNRYS